MRRKNWETEKETLENLIIIDNLSYEEIGRRYKCSGVNIKKVAIKLGIELPNRRKISPCETFNRGKNNSAVCLNCGKVFYHYKSKSKKYCSSHCKTIYEHNQRYQKIINGDPSIMRANYSPRLFKENILKEQGGVCATCGSSQEWNNKPLVFILDHIDGHASNNRRDNLRCICPNCDSQLDTFKSKNKCGDRSYYRYHKYNIKTLSNSV